METSDGILHPLRRDDKEILDHLVGMTYSHSTSPPLVSIWDHFLYFILLNSSDLHGIIETICELLKFDGLMWVQTET